MAAASVNDSRPSALTPALTPAPSSSDELPVPPSAPEAPKARKPRVAIGLTLAIAGGAAAWYTSAAAAVLINGLIASYIAIPALAFTIGWVALGALAGFAAFSVETWKGFPADLKDSSLTAGAMTFKFWGRFGLIFDSVLRGKSADGAMKQELSANLFKYPVIAWLFVLAGYVMAPVAFVLGAAYRLVGTPFLAALRGLRDVIVGFLPWMKQVIDFVGRFIVRIFPFFGGLIWGAVKGVFFSAAAGAALLAAPIAHDAFYSSYKPASVPGWIGYRLTQLAALAAILVTGALGAAIGLVVGPLHALMFALGQAFKWGRFSPKAETFFNRWTRSVEKDGAFDVLIGRRFPAAEKSLSLAARTVRVLNGVAIAAYGALALPFLSIATFWRASVSAYKGTDAQSGDSGPNRADEEGAEAKVEPRDGIALPATLAVIGAAVAAGAVGYLLILPLTLANIGLLAAAAAVGAASGLALSQPQAWKGTADAVLAQGSLGATQSWGGWMDAGARVAAALRGESAPRASENKFFLALPAVAGGVSAVLSAFVADVLVVAGRAVAASWTGFMAVITQFLPALKRFLNRLVEVLKDIVPFFFGFVFGTIGGVFKSAWWLASNLFRPVGAIFEREDGLRSKPGEWQITAGVALGLTLLVPAAAIFVGGLALGAVLGLPVALTHGVALGSKWAGTSREDYYRTWERRSLPQALREARSVAEISLSGEGRELPVWRVYVRAASWALASIPTALALTVAGGKAYLASLQDAKLEKSPEQAARPSSEEAPVVEPAADAPLPNGKVVISAVLGALGLGAGVVAAIAFAPGWLAGLAGWKLWALGAAAYVGVPVASTGVALAVSQPALWTRLIPNAADAAKAGWGRSLNYWIASGKAVGLAKLYALPGFLSGLALGTAGVAFGVLQAGSVAAYRGADQVVREILPFLRWAWETAAKIARRIFPFLFGLVAGAVSGVLGSAAFGALLLGRPYFKHVVADDFEYKGALGFLGNVFLKLVAFALGVAFGLVGIVAGVIAAAPYALTAMVSFAFRFAEIGGPAGKFFDHWTYGSLRAELQRLNSLTDRFQFPEGKAALSDGWIRMANIFPATFAAAIAGTIAGWVGYFRSVGVAYKTAKSGAPIPEPVADREAGRRWNSTWRSSKKAAGSFFIWGIAGAVLGLGLMAMTSWAPFGLTGLLLVAAVAGAGMLAALALGGLIAAIALVLWLDAQLR
ncbi:MAG: hypothetical protein M0D55_02770 [Elusimicrobiota bacterium]|nr:MAG: hypothetical protein M0D55_02770 [Elusimicrobiota bacterium]